MQAASKSTAPATLDFIDPASPLAADVAEFVKQGISFDANGIEPDEGEFWRKLCDVETQLWLDTGDIEAIRSLWNRQFTGVTTNNALLNTEIQKQVYEEWIASANSLLKTLAPEFRIREIGFVLSVRHALRLAEEFRCPISVELHTDVAQDVEATLAYARRCHAICPEFFVVKIPLTPAGLIATKRLRSEGLPINCTLGFSARQNYIATAVANPSFVNVFLGRLNAYVVDNGLGDGRLVGEKATIASQSEVRVFALGLPQAETRQIAASVRDAHQLPQLAGVDIITMPPQVARQAREQLRQPWQPRVNEDYQVSLSTELDPETVRLEKLWDVEKHERNFVQKLILNPPETPEDFLRAATEYEVRDLFPQWSGEELETIAEDGKIPQHQRWSEKIAAGEVAIDSLLTAAGLASFAAAQAEVDDRIRQKIA